MSTTKKLQFSRADGRDRILNGNRPSTDANGAVVNWADPNKRRFYRVVLDEDDVFEATIIFESSDVDAMGDLHIRCAKVGVVDVEINNADG